MFLRYEDISAIAGYLWPLELEEKQSPPKPTCSNYPCFGTNHILRPIHVDDKEGILFLQCPVCRKYYHRPEWYETPEEQEARLLRERISQLEERITKLEELLKKSTEQTKPEATKDIIELPSIMTI